MSNLRTKTGSLSYAKYQLQRAILENVLEKNFTSDDYEASLKFFNNACAFCGSNNIERKDHLVSVIRHGDFIRSNVVPACQLCDDSKGQKEYHD